LTTSAPDWVAHHAIAQPEVPALTTLTVPFIGQDTRATLRAWGVTNVDELLGTGVAVDI
jgi:hypothetical protein